MASLEFVVPAVPPSLNGWSRRHWSVRRKAAEDWDRLVWAQWRLAGGGRIDPAIVTLTFRLPRGGDPDNRAKFVLDGLKRRAIVDDGPPHLVELRLRSERGSPAETRIRIESSPDPSTPKD